LRQLFRMFHINYVLAKHGLDAVGLSIPLFAPIRFLAHLNPWNWFADKNKPRAVRIRLALEELGPIFVKFGQSLSTRSDLVPEDIVLELTKLQDKVPPFPSEVAISIVEKQYGEKVDTVFTYFDPQPKASASIAQVHEVELTDGKRAVIKILRPKIEKQINRDIDLLYTLAGLAERYWPNGRRLHPVDVVAEFDKIIHDELDLMREAANASQLRRNFSGSDILKVPEIYWPYARQTVLVMEYIEGIPIADLNALKSHGINMKKLAERGVEIFFTQVFRDSFFHADMHPGNIFVNPNRPEDPQYIAVDFGIMGTLSPEDKRYLAYNMLAFFRRDYRWVAKLHVESGWVAPDTRIDEFESAIRTVCEPIFEKPLKEISFGRTLMRLFQTGRRFNMEIQPQLILLQKTLLHVEGLGRKLYPELDLWESAKPYLEKWMKQQTGPRALAQKIYEHAPTWLEQLPEMPELIADTLKTLRAYSKQTAKESKETVRKTRNNGRKMWQFLFASLGLGLGITAALHFYVLQGHVIITPSMVFGLGAGALVALFIAVLLSR